MIKLIVGNSYSKITGLTLTQQKALSKVLSYEIPASAHYFSGSYRSRERTLLHKRGFYPSGLTYLVEGWLDANKLIAEFDDKRSMPTRLPTEFKLSLGCTPYPEQTAAVATAVRAGRGCIVMPTGCGKSITMAMLTKALNVRTLIIVPTLELRRQLTESFTKFFGSFKNISIYNIDSPELKAATDYDCLIVDEGHHVAARTYRELNKKQWTKIYHRFFFTATPFRSQEEEQLLYESIAGPVEYEVTYDAAVKAGHIVPMEAYYIELPPRDVRGSTYQQVYKELVVANTQRNLVIRDIILNLLSQGKSTLCLLKEIAHGNNIQSLSGASIQFASGVNDDTKHLIDLFNSSDLPVLMGTVGVLGEGVDTKPAEFVIIAGLGKSRNQFMQMCGRGFRRYPGKETCKIILFKDLSHKWSANHFREQCKILKNEYGIKPVKLDIETEGSYA